MSTDEPHIEGDPDQVEEPGETPDEPVKPRPPRPEHHPYDDPLHIPPPII